MLKATRIYTSLTRKTGLYPVSTGESDAFREGMELGQLEADDKTTWLDWMRCIISRRHEDPWYRDGFENAYR